jgi:hypothetical protein
MIKRFPPVLAAAVLAALLYSSSAGASFGLDEPDVTFTGEDGSASMVAGSHPYAFTTLVTVNTKPAPNGVLPDDEAKDVLINFPPGLVGTPNPVPRCSTADFVLIIGGQSNCPASTAVGVAVPVAGFGEMPNSPKEERENFEKVGGLVPVYNLAPAPGSASKIGFTVLGEPVTVETTVNPDPPYNLVSHVTNIINFFRFYTSRVTLWGVPADPIHDNERGQCSGSGGNQTCPVTLPQIPFLTLPTACSGPMPSTFIADSWQNPGVWTEPLTVYTHDSATPPNPLGMGGCEKLGFKPTISAKPTTLAAGSPSGLDFSLDVKDEGLTNPHGQAQSGIKKAVVTLPEGMSVNPSIAEGLEVCTQAQLARETPFSEAGAGCPNASKIGSVEVETPLLDENVNGALYQAAPYDNPFNSLIALYVVIKNPVLGIKVVQPLKVETDPVRGRLTTVSEDMPQLPFSHFRLHFREGARSPLASPPACGTYNAEATLYPHSGGAPVRTTSAFQIITGPESKPCPTGGLPPFRPGLIAGTLNNAAGRFSPFNVRLFRNDSEQEITHFSIKLPPGVVGKLAGIPFCSNAAIAAAKARTGPHGGQEEINGPSCPAASQIGHTLVGSGVGSALAYAPGKLYLAGPYNGSALSLVAITAGRVGPFDLGTVVIREAFKIDPETAEVFIDATGSDPIPHIIKGVPVHLRDIRAYTDRPNFVLNPTSCKRTSTASTLLGSGLDFGSEADDRPVTVSTPFQAADCAALPFKPRLSLKLKGGTKRGSYPALRATLNMNGIGEAGIDKAQVTLPGSEFIAQSHFNTICTRVQFKQGLHPGEKCPAGSIYGKVMAETPILDDPLTGPVFLRSSEHQLPDVVAALHNGQIDVVLVGRVDSVKGRLRTTFESTPDAPVKRAVFSFMGGKKGLFENSTNLCRSTHKAIAAFAGQNGKQWNFNPVVKPTGCKKARKANGKAAKRKRRAN